jgi:hypothetical protein
MLLQVRPRCESFLANLALERLFSGVDTLMANQVRDLAEVDRTPWECTLIGLKLVMDPRMLLKTRVLRKFLVALITTYKEDVNEKITKIFSFVAKISNTINRESDKF